MTTFTLDGRAVAADAGETVWQAAQRAGVELPHLCLSTAPDFRADGNCRACLVEIDGQAQLAASCIVPVEPGMVVRTTTARATAARRGVLELMRADVTPRAGTELAHWCDALGVETSRYPARETVPVDDSAVGLQVDLNACIHCMRCVQACREVECTDVIGMAGRAYRSQVVFDFGVAMGDSTCVSCGSCAQTCPTDAIRLRGAA